MKYTKIPLDTFENMELNAGILLTKFDPENQMDDDELYKYLLGATSGGIKVSATASYSDLGEDIDNCPKNTKELKHRDSWEVVMSGTFVTLSAELMVRLLASAEYDEETGKITIKQDVDSDTDFSDIWWVGDYNQGKGFVACDVLNALSTGGLVIQSTDQQKGTSDFEFTGHYTITDQDRVPLECYLLTGDSEADTGDGGDGNDGGDTEPDDEQP